MRIPVRQVAQTGRNYLIRRHNLCAPYAPQPPTMAPIAKPFGPPASAPIPMEVPTTATRKTFSPFEIPWRFCCVSRAYDLLRFVCLRRAAGARGSDDVACVEVELASCVPDGVAWARGTPLTKANSGTIRLNARTAIMVLFILLSPKDEIPARNSCSGRRLAAGKPSYPAKCEISFVGVHGARVS